VQIRRVLLLFALVLGLSALVAALAPAPEEEESQPAEPTTVEAGAPQPFLKPGLELRVRGPGAPLVTRRVDPGSSFSLTVSAREPGDVILEGLGLRQTADPLSPAHFELLASPRGNHAVTFVPLEGKSRVVGRLSFAEAPAVKPRRRDR
jgi:hypothetical protein